MFEGSQNLSHAMCINIHTYISYSIYINRERERERDTCILRQVRGIALTGRVGGPRMCQKMPGVHEK